MLNNLYNPLEDDECIAFSQWLRLHNIPHAHIANESRSHTKNAMIRGAKLKRMGQSRGVWDYEVYVPQKNGKYKLVKIEMKRKHGGRVTAEQKQWGEIYRASRIECAICRGSEEAVKVVENYLQS